MSETEGSGRWLFIGLLTGALLMFALYGLPPILGDAAPANCNDACLAALDLPAQRSMAAAAWAMFAVTAVSAGIGAASLALIWLNLIEARRLAGDSAVSAQAAVDAAKAAAASNEVAREMGMAQTRAYIAITGVTGVLLAHRSLEIRVYAANSGQTPARLIRMDLDVEALQWVDDAFVPLFNGVGLPSWEATLPAGDPAHLRQSISLDELHFQTLNQGTGRVLAGGTIHFTDVFGHRQREEFRFESPQISYFATDAIVAFSRIPEQSS